MTGIFGGMFDPPHNGHVAVLEGASRAFDFDELLVLVVGDDPDTRESLAMLLRLEGHEVVASA